MYSLVIDRGNSACKWAFFERGRLEEPVEVVHTDSGEFLNEEFFEKYRPQACIYSSVGRCDEGEIEALRQRVPHFLKYTADVPIPIRNAYRTPKTLGLDRLAAAVGAWTLAPGRTSLIVDMGTAITYDLLRGDGTYIGGNIAPGIWLRFKALHENTAALPMVDASADFPPIGTDTHQAILSGVMQGVKYELQGYMAALNADFPGLLTFLTGGDIIYFDNYPKSGIFAVPNLVLTGLNRILQENVPE